MTRRDWDEIEREARKGDDRMAELNRLIAAGVGDDPEDRTYIESDRASDSKRRGLFSKRGKTLDERCAEMKARRSGHNTTFTGSPLACFASPEIRKFVDEFCEHNKVGYEQLTAVRNRDSELTLLRAELCICLRKKGLSVQKIARIMRRHVHSVDELIKRYAWIVGQANPQAKFDRDKPDLSGEWAI